jgi:hypothetical protein
MKKLVFFVSVLFLALIVKAAAPLVTDAPVLGYGPPVTVAISSTTLTKVPTTQTSGRVGIYFDNSSTNTARMVGFFGDCTSTSLAVSIRPIEIAPGNNSTYFSMREDVCLWLLDLNTAAASENAHYQEVKQ